MLAHGRDQPVGLFFGYKQQEDAAENVLRDRNGSRVSKHRVPAAIYARACPHRTRTIDWQ